MSGALLAGNAAMAEVAPPIIAGDEKPDIRYPFAWTERTGEAMVYDTARECVVVYGGTEDDSVCPTMEWDGAGWRGVWTTNRPAARTGHAIAYDPARRESVLFGGESLNETWLYDGNTWTQATPAVSPPGRVLHAMAYDSVSQRVLMYAGKSDVNEESCLDDFWAWDGTNWTDLGAVPAEMPALHKHAMACDTNRGVTVLYGGLSYRWWTNGLNQVVWRTWPNQETWEWNGASWSNTAPSGTPPKITTKGAYLAYNPDTASIESLTLGSFAQEMDAYYAYDGATWTKTDISGTTPGIGPIAYDAARHEFVGIPEGEKAWFFTGTKWVTKGFYPAPSGDGGYPLLWKDWNGDGRPDMLMPGDAPTALADGYTDAVGLFHMTPSGFDHVPAALTRVMGQVATRGDMNGDGYADLAVGKRYTSGANLWVFPGNAAGSFSSSATWTKTVSSWDVLELEWKDTDRDGDMDLAVLYGDPGSSGLPRGVAIYRNNGSTLGASPDVDISFEDADAYYGWMAWADINLDGTEDFAVAIQSDPNTVNVYTNRGDGTFTNLVILGGYAGEIEFADINGDWYPDIVGPGFAYTNNRGQFGQQPAWEADVLTDYQEEKFGQQCGDIDGDGDIDVTLFLQLGRSGVDAYVYRNDAGQLTEKPVWSASSTDMRATKGAIADYDGDGDLDIAARRGISLLEPRWHSVPTPLESPFWLRSAVNPDDSTTALVTWDPMAGPDVAGYRLYDQTTLISNVTTDQTEVVVGTNEATRVYLASVDKAGREYGFSGPALIYALEPTNSTQDSTLDFWCMADVMHADLDGDGDEDLFEECTSPHPITSGQRVQWVVYTNDGSGTFATAWQWRESDSDQDTHGPGRVTPLSFGLVNDDALPDLICKGSSVVVNSNGVPETRWFLEVYTNTVNAFVLDSSWCPLLPASCQPTRIAWGNADGQSGQDIVVSASYGFPAYLFLNQGGRFADTPAWNSVESNIIMTAFGALDTDGRDDLAVIQYDTLEVSVYQGTVSGLTETAVWTDTAGVAGESVKVTWDDFDDDNDLDLTIHGYEGSSLRNHPTILYENDAGTLSYLCVYKSRDYKDGAGVGIGGSSGFTSGWADMDNDGDLDLWGRELILEAATPPFNAGPIGEEPTYWHGHAGEEGWGRYPPFSSVEDVCDFNGDGTPDFLMGSQVMLRTPGAIYQADYEVYIPNSESATLEDGRMVLYPEGTLLLSGHGGTQTVEVALAQSDGSEIPIPYDPDFLSFTISGNPAIGTPYVTVSNNVLIAHRNGTVLLTVKYADFAYELTGIIIKAQTTRTVQVTDAPWLPEILEITPSTVTLNRIGEARTLTVTRQYPDGTLEDVTDQASWGISDPGVLGRDGQIIIAQNNGTAEVVATYDGMAATCQVTVAAAVTLSGLSLAPSQASIMAGEIQAFEVRAHYSDGSVEPVTFLSQLTSDSPGVAQVWGNGVLGVTSGFANVSATYQGQNASALVAVDTPDSEWMFEITGVTVSDNAWALNWYCTTPPGTTTPFTVWCNTNLMSGDWNQLPGLVPRHPSGYHSWSFATNGQDEAFFRITSP
ncbi:FG-GAP-like repeat-containing protein [Verrucomicrobiota bacterium]